MGSRDLSRAEWIARIRCVLGAPSVESDRSADADRYVDGGFVVVLIGEDDIAALPQAQRDALVQGDLCALVLAQHGNAVLQPPPERALVAVVDRECSDAALAAALIGLRERWELRAAAKEHRKRLDRVQYELRELLEIARAISQERDIGRLLDLILAKSRFITGADAGSIYVVDSADSGASSPEGCLRFKLSQNDSIEFASAEFTVPISMHSIAGAAVVTRRAIVVDDVYAIGGDAPWRFDRSFDERTGYRTRSVIAVPMISAEERVLGVIQLINRKLRGGDKLTDEQDFLTRVASFDARGRELLESLASQAGIALENALLYDEIRGIFDGFVRASVQAIEQRDPTTSGHSLRVSLLSCELARVVDRVPTGPFSGAAFSARDLRELEYAALLHDFGKIGVREQVLIKAKKLYPHELEAIRARFDYATASQEAHMLRRRVELLRRGAPPAEIDALEAQFELARSQIDEAWRVIMAFNEPTVLSEGDFSRIDDMGRLTYLDASGQRRPLLTVTELESLRISKGSLQPQEVDEIRSHVVHTFDFLSRIPWGKSLARIPAIAGAHHERLDGTGYPRRVGGEAIPLQSRIMAVADIYDALTARDRPYKKALPRDRALQILDYEVRDRHLDGELVRLFREANVYAAVEVASMGG